MSSNNGPFYAVGLYQCEVREQALAVNANSGNQQIVIKFTVLAHYENGEAISEHKQYDRTYYRSITEKSIDYALADMDALGLCVTSFGQIDQNAPNCVSIVGKTVDMFCNHEADNSGGMRERWSVSTRSASKPLEYKPADSKQVRALDAMFGQALKTRSPKPAPQLVNKPQPAASMAQAIPDDDVPF